MASNVTPSIPGTATFRLAVVRCPQRLQLRYVHVQAPEPLGLVGLRLVVEPPPQVLQTDGRHCQIAPAFRVVGGTAEQQGPFAPRALPRFTATAGPSATLSPSAHFPGALVIGPIASADFARGEEGFSSGSTCPRHRAVAPTPPEGSPRQPDCGESCGLRRQHCSASGCLTFRGYLCVHSRYGPVTRSPSSRWLRRWASGLRLPPSCHPSYGARLLPRRVCLPLNTSTLSGHTLAHRRLQGRRACPPNRAPRPGPSRPAPRSLRRHRPGRPLSSSTARWLGGPFRSSHQSPATIPFAPDVD